MKSINASRRERGPGTPRLAYRLVSLTAALAIGLLPVLGILSPADATPKGVLTLNKTVGLTANETLNLNLTNYPAEEVQIKYCVLTGPGLTAGECSTTTPTVTVPNAAGGRGDATATVVAAEMIGTNNCTKSAICGVITESANTPVNTDSAAKLPVAFGTPTLTVLGSRVPGTAVNSPVTVKGSGFRPGHVMRLTQCNNSAAAGTSCRATSGEGYAEPTVDSTGNFEITLNVSGTYVLGANTLVCTDGSITCGVQTSSKTSGADRTQQAMVDLKFVGVLSADKTAGINEDGETVTATGAGFQANTDLYLANCDTAAAPGTGCDMANAKTVTTNATGGFTQAIEVGSFSGTDCLVKACALQTSKVTAPTDASQAATLPLAFAAAPPVTTAAMTASKTTGLNPHGETITVTGTGFQPNIDLYLANCDTDIPAGQECDAANLKIVTTNASGKFTQAVKVGSFTGTDCLVKACGLQTSKVGAGADATQSVTVPLSFVAAPPAKTAKLTANKTTGLKASGETIKAKGTGFQPNVSLYLVNCDTAIPSGAKCDMANFKIVKTNASGAFTQAVKVASFKGTNCLVKACGLQTSKVGAGADESQSVTLLLKFVKTSPPAAKPKLIAPKVVKAGSKITVRGKNFQPGQKIVTALCKKSAKTGKSCWTAKSKTAKVNKNGAFRVKLKTAKKFKSKQGKVKCGKAKCAIKTWNKAKPGDRASKVVHKIKYGKKTVMKKNQLILARAKSGPSISVSKASGLNPAGESVSVKGSGFNSNVGLFVALCNTAVPAGGACDMGNFKQVSTNGSGAFPATSIKVVAKFTGGDGSSVDCTVDPCALQTSQVGSGNDGVTTASVKFAAAGSTGDGTKDDQNKGDDNSTGGTTTGGTSAGSGSSGGSILPATGSGNYLALWAAGLVLMIGGVTLSMRSRTD